MAMPRFTASFTNTNCPPDSSSTRQVRSRFLLRTSMSKSSTKPRPSALGRCVRKRISNLLSKSVGLGALRPEADFELVVEAALKQGVHQGRDLRSGSLDLAKLDFVRAEDSSQIG